MSILISIITGLLLIIAFFLKRLIANIDVLTKTINEVNTTMTLYVYKTDENEQKITGVHAEVRDLHDRFLVIENEHKNRKCK